MWKIFRAFAPAGAGKQGPGPIAGLAWQYCALDTAAWALARRRTHPAEADPR